jgi:SAM-dependent methyltransferase
MEKQLKAISQLYSDNLKNHGETSKGVGWPDEKSQLLRFDKLAQVLSNRPSDQPIIVNDLGSGYGAMYEYFVDHSVPVAHYYGYDINPEMLRAAQKRIAADNVTFINSSKLTNTADYSFVSGTFNVKMTASEQDWEAFVKETLNDLREHSTLGFAFNLLTTFVDWKKDVLYYADPMHYFEYCKNNFSRYVTLLHDYPLYEWTLLVFLQNPNA